VLADKLAKEAARNSDMCYSKIPKSEIEHQKREKSIEKWQQQWDHTTKGSATKEFFPNIKYRLKMKSNTQLHGNGNSSWKDKIIPTSIQDN